MTRTASKPDQPDINLAGRRARLGDVVEIRLEDSSLVMAEIDAVGPSTLFAKDDVSVFELHGEGSGPDHVVHRHQIVRLWREVTR